MIELKQFQQDAMRTESTIETVKTTKHNVVAALLATIAAAELLDHIKKHVFYGKPVNPLNREKALEQMHTALHALTNLTDIDDDVEDLEVNPRIFHHIIGIITEAGELAENLLGQITNPYEPIDGTNIAEECGDTNWYIACLLDELGVGFEDTLHKIISKLKARYPDKFDSNRAINRDIDNERAILEK